MAQSFKFANTAENERLHEISKKYGIPIFDEIELNDSASRAQFVTANMNNAASAMMMEEQNAFNAQEAEKSREFNAEQAQIAREWNSEQAVMERRAEAGLNTSITGQGGTTGGGSGASASSTPAHGANVPSLATPNYHPSQIPEYLDAAVKIAKAPAEVAQSASATKQALANVDKLNAETESEKLRAQYQRIVNDYSPEMISEEIRKLVSETSVNNTKATLDKQQTITASALASYYNAQVYDILPKAYLNFVQGELGPVGVKLNIQGEIANYEQVCIDLDKKTEFFEKEWKKNITDIAYSHGKVESDFDKKMKGKNWSLQAKLERNVGVNIGVAKVGGSGSLSGQYGQNSASENLNSSVQKFINTDVYNKLVETRALSKIIRDPKSTAQERIRALSELYDIDTSVGAFAQKQKSLIQIYNELMPQMHHDTAPLSLPSN